MELFLNLCWLSLLLPAYLLWRRRIASTSATETPAVRPLVFICALGCAFVLLFPVISATDDLHAMRAEMEESSPGKRSVCQAAGEKASIWHSRWQNLSAIVATTASLGLISERRLELFTLPLSIPAAPSTLRASRAPPCSRLA
ncbi:MAG: hypothetical protein ABSG07_06615 [Terriglobales bacterium]|jgi:hypothetical protein